MSRILNTIARQKLNAARKAFTRAKALKVITAENCSEDRFVKHANKHVKARAAHLAAREVAPQSGTTEVEPDTLRTGEAAAE